MPCFPSEFIFFQLAAKKNCIAFGSVGFFFLLQLEHGYGLTVFSRLSGMSCTTRGFQLEVFQAYVGELCKLTSWF